MPERLHPMAGAFFSRVSKGGETGRARQQHTRLAEKSGRAAACSSTGVPTTVVERLRRRRQRRTFAAGVARAKGGRRRRRRQRRQRVDGLWRRRRGVQGRAEHIAAAAAAA